MNTRRGSALVIVLGLSLGLVTLALLYADAMRMEYQATDNALAGRQAEAAVEGARRYVAFVLGNLAETGALPDVEEYETEAVPVGDAKFWLLARNTGEDLLENDQAYGLVDEGAKLNLNTATLEMLEALPGMPPSLAAAIVDWRDADNEITQDGAESETYLLRDPAYYCKDAPFETVEEIRLLLDANMNVLYGEDGNRNGALEDCEDNGDESQPADNADGTLNPGLLEYLTVYSRVPNVQEDGTARVNVNNRQDGSLEQLLAGALGQERATEIRKAAGNRTFRSVLEFYLSTGMTADEFAEVDDKLTASEGDFVAGLINVNTAPAAVLACIPGVGEALAKELVDYRTGNPESLESLAWVANVLDAQAAGEAGQYLTTQSYQFTADVAAVGHHGLGLRRVQFVFDTSGEEPKVLYRRDLSRLGWPLPAELRRELKNPEDDGGLFS